MQLTDIFTYQLVHTTLRASAPIVMATVAAILSKQANILNIGIEGVMLFGAFTGIAVNCATGSWYLGVLAAVVLAILISAAVGAMHLKYKVNIVILGFTLNSLALGATRLMMQRLFGVVGAYAPSEIAPPPRVHFDAFVNNPVLDSLFNGYSILEILSYVFLLGLWFVLYKTRLGLHLRSVGLEASAAATAGINVQRTKFWSIALSGIFAGLAGAHLSMGYSSMFVENMSAGRGFMATAAMNFGGGNPLNALLGCLLFGLCDSIALRLQALSLPSQFVSMLPYAMTVLILTISMIRQEYRRYQKEIAQLRKQELPEGIMLKSRHSKSILNK